MLIDFTFSNYRSIKNEVTLSLVTSNHSDPNNEDIKIIPIENGKFNLLSFIGLYGPNASGKSNIIKAFSEFRDMIRFSHKFDIDQDIPAYEPFKLDRDFVDQPIKFEAEFIVNEIRYLYIYEFTAKEISQEELWFWPEGKKAKLFVREKDNVFSYGSYFKGEKKSIEKNLLPNTLFLSKAANSSHKILVPIYRYFRDCYKIHVNMDSGSLPSPILATTEKIIEEESVYKDLVIGILNAGDINIKDIKIVKDKKISELVDDKFKDVEKESFSGMLTNIISKSLSNKVLIGHSLYSDDEETDDIVYFELSQEESSGTIKMYDMAVQIIDSLKNGNTLLIDEFNSGLHPHLNNFIVDLFLDPDINKKGAQLIISTHDTCILESEKIRRDQIWFTDKDKYGKTELFSLDEFDKNEVRSNTNFAKWYLDGRFRAIPTLSYNKIKIWDN